MKATRARKTTMAICLVLVLTIAFFSNGLAQSGAPGVCTGDEQSPCGFPVEGNPAEMIGVSRIHDSCVPEGSCPWIQGIDIWWPGNPSSTERPTNLLSVLNGKVVTAGHIDGAGNPVIAIRNTYYLCYYLHADAVYVSVGQDVKIGDPLGLMGIKGRTSNTTHVHFSCKLNDRELSLRQDELMPMLAGWSEVSGVNPQPLSYVAPAPAESAMSISLDDLPYAMANQVVFTIPYTPTPEQSVPATPEAQPTQILVQPPQTALPLPESSSTPNANLLWVALGLLGAAWLLSPDNRGRRERNE